MGDPGAFDSETSKVQSTSIARRPTFLPALDRVSLLHSNSALRYCILETRTSAFLVRRSLNPWEPHPDLKPFIPLLIALCSACMLSAYHLPGAMLGAGNKP